MSCIYLQMLAISALQLRIPYCGFMNSYPNHAINSISFLTMWPNCAKPLSTLAQIQLWLNKLSVRVYNSPALNKVLLVQMFTDNNGRTCWTEIYLDNFSAADFHTTQSSLLVCGAQCLTTEKYVNCSILVMNTPPDFVQKL